MEKAKRSGPATPAPRAKPAAKTAFVKYPPESSVGYLLRDTHRAFSRILQASIAPWGVTMGMWYFLRALWDEDGLTQRELSRRVGMMEPTTVSALNHMERRGLIERIGLMFQQRQVMQGIKDELRLAVAAGMGGDDLAATSDLHPVDISLRQNLLVAMARGNGVVVVAIPNQRQRRDAGSDLMTGVNSLAITTP